MMNTLSGGGTVRFDPPVCIDQCYISKASERVSEQDGNEVEGITKTEKIAGVDLDVEDADVHRIDSVSTIEINVHDFDKQYDLEAIKSLLEKEYYHTSQPSKDLVAPRQSTRIRARNTGRLVYTTNIHGESNLAKLRQQIIEKTINKTKVNRQLAVFVFQSDECLIQPLQDEYNGRSISDTLRELPTPIHYMDYPVTNLLVYYGDYDLKDKSLVENSIVVDNVDTKNPLSSHQQQDDYQFSSSVAGASTIGDNTNDNLPPPSLRPLTLSVLDSASKLQLKNPTLQQHQTQRILLRRRRRRQQRQRRRQQEVTTRDNSFSRDYPSMSDLAPCVPPPFPEPVGNASGPSLRNKERKKFSEEAFPEPVLDPCARDLTYIRDRDGQLRLYQDEILVRTTTTTSSSSTTTTTCSVTNNTNSTGRVGRPIMFCDALSLNITSRGGDEASDGEDNRRRDTDIGVHEYNRAYSIMGEDGENNKVNGCSYCGIVLSRSSPEDDWKMTSEECTIHKLSWESMRDEGCDNSKSTISRNKDYAKTRNECAVMQYLKNYYTRHLPSSTTTTNSSQAVSTERMLTHQTNIMIPLDILYDRLHLYIIKPPSNGGDELLIRCQTEPADEEECRFLLTQILDGVEWLRRAGVCHLSITLEDIMIVGNGTDGDDDGEGRTIAIDNLGMCVRIPYVKVIAAEEGVLDVVTSDEKVLSQPPAIAVAVAPTNNNEKSRRMPLKQSSCISHAEQGTNDRYWWRKDCLISRQHICGNVPLYYISPEVYNKQLFSEHTVDLWAVGIILFIMLTKRQPWEKPHTLDTAFRHMTQGHLTTTIRDGWNVTGLSENAMDLLQKMLALDPADRLSLDQVRSHPWMQRMGPRETLGFFYDYLKSFTVRESLDEDKLIRNITSKDRDKFPVRHQPQSRMQLLEVQVNKVQEDCWNDNDLFNREEDKKSTTTNCGEKSMVNTTVSNKFFDSIMKETEEPSNIHNSVSSNKKRYHQMKDLDAPTIKGLRSSLCIYEEKKVRTNREVLLQSTGEHDILYECGKDESHSSSKRRLTRGMVRDTKKKIREEWESRETSCFDALVAAMIEIEIEDRGRKRLDRERKNKSRQERNSAQKQLPLSVTSKRKQTKEMMTCTSKKRRIKENSKIKITVNNDRAEPTTKKRSHIEEHIPTSSVLLIAEIPAGRKGNGRRSSRRINVLNVITKTIRVRLNIGDKLHELADLNITPAIPTPRKGLSVSPVIPATGKYFNRDEVR